MSWNFSGFLNGDALFQISATQKEISLSYLLHTSSGLHATLISRRVQNIEIDQKYRDFFFSPETRDRFCVRVIIKNVTLFNLIPLPAGYLKVCFCSWLISLELIALNCGGSLFLMMPSKGIDSLIATCRIDRSLWSEWNLSQSLEE